jgi:hypothetical protein
MILPPASTLQPAARAAATDTEAAREISRHEDNARKQAARLKRERLQRRAAFVMPEPRVAPGAKLSKARLMARR